jgi:hypothetical protein
MSRRPSSRQQKGSNLAGRALTSHHEPTLLRWCNGLLREGSWWPLWWGSLDGMKGVRGAPECQQSASNPASHSLASHVLAIEVSRIYLRRCEVKAGHV